MLKVPKILGYQSVPLFFKDFVEMNSDSISFRSFARGLDWPPALLSDLVHGHRGLSVARAIEFGRHVEMNNIEIERLIMLTIAQNENISVKEFVDDYFKFEGKEFPAPKPDSISPEDVPRETPVNVADHDLASLKMILVWSDGKITAEEIGRLLYLSPNLKDPKVLNQKLDLLRKNRFIEGELPDIRVLQKSSAATGMNRSQYFKTLEALRPILDQSASLCHWNMGRFTLHREDYPELNQRMLALVNWILNRSREQDPTAMERDNFVLLQFNFMLTHLLHLPSLGLRIERDSEPKFTIEQA